jgi:Uma2 family endonuclease
MVKPRLKYTVADYMTTPDDKRYQLLDGDLILAPSPSDRHQSIVGHLHVALYQFINSNGLGRVRLAPLDVFLTDHDVAQPDILYVSDGRSNIFIEGKIQGAPDLVVEILSPSTQGHDRGYKQTLYAQHGVREYWLVDPDSETVEVLTEGEYGFIPAATYYRNEILASPLLPGLAIDLHRVFNE